MGQQAFALETPHKGRFDDRVRFIDYEPAEVVKLVGHYGFSTHIHFSPSETVKQIAMGDKDAWEVAPVNNHIFIKPTSREATTNMTVITTKRIYNFELSAHLSKQKARSNDMLFQVNFRYPDEEQKTAQKRQEAEILQERLEGADDVIPSNWNYWVKGSQDVTPSRAFDDGQFTYLSFDPHAEMPAIYVVDENGLESLVNTHIDIDDPNTIIVHKIARQLVMRKGQSVSCVFNHAYKIAGSKPYHNMTVRGVVREMKGVSHGRE